MPIRSLDLLPEFFQTETNKKFLSATVDKLISEPKLKKISGFVGRKILPNYKTDDPYVLESDATRQNYQLEPSVVIRDEYDKLSYVNSYPDLIAKIKFYNGKTDNHSRLFNDEYYNFDGQIDYDKFVNFSQYYWLPAGPDRVSITNASLDFGTTINTSLDRTNGNYTFNNIGTFNPTISLKRGGTYTFTVDQIGSKFWIQTEPGVSGTKSYQDNVSSREILGVVNNGIIAGTLTFNVPVKDAQDYLLDLPLKYSPDLATRLNYRDLANVNYDAFMSAVGNIDGQRNIDGKTIVFLEQANNTELWAVGTNPDPTVNYTTLPYDGSGYVDPDYRVSVWRLRVDRVTDPANPYIRLDWLVNVDAGEKVRVKEGTEFGNLEYYSIAGDYNLTRVPVITAPETTLYYQDSSNPDAYGTIRILDDLFTTTVDVDADIIGKSSYTTNSGVVFTNGLKVLFDNSVSPTYYQNKEFYVEGVGRAIKLVPVAELITPEGFLDNVEVPFDSVAFDSSAYDESQSSPQGKDYLTINRASQDRNVWSRGNRWFHIDVINATAVYNNFIPIIDQAARANRPIVEFDADLQLFNSGKLAKANIDLFDISQTDAFSNVEGAASYTIDGYALTNGMRVIFSADLDDNVRNKIYVVNLVDPEDDGSTQIHLVLADDGEIAIYDQLTVLFGATRKGNTYWFNGTEWALSQIKTNINQAPLFDVFDQSGNSFGDTTVYPGTDFIGTELFGYKVGTGADDANLGFPLTYRNFNNIGDIVFENFFSTRSFTYDLGTVALQTGYVHKYMDRTNYQEKNLWQKVATPTKQFQQYTYIYTTDMGTAFEIDSAPDADTTVKNLLVYVNNVPVSNSLATTYTARGKTYLNLEYTFAVSDKIDILIYNSTPATSSYYSIPQNLEYNGINFNFTDLTLGQLRNHVNECFTNSTLSAGVFPGSSNLRDINIKNVGGKILQHSSPVTFAQLFLTHPDYSFVNSITYAQREYAKFKNRFLLSLETLSGLDHMDPISAVDEALSYINQVKDSSFPFYYSDMLGYGDQKETITYNITTVEQIYDIAAIYDPFKPSKRSVLVYRNGEQLILGRDFTFNSDRPAITINIDNITLVAGDVLTVVDYNNTNGSWIPETPTKMGMYPSFIPELRLDDTYRTSMNVIQGHDGSITPAFNDFRDAVILELENRIYNNIKVKYDASRLDIHEIIPGKFRNTDYTLAEFNQIIANRFLTWVGNNRLDFSTNSDFKNGDDFTWNYRASTNKIDGNYLPGGWRKIYQYYYDTDRPHTHAWEMLGFSEKPWWWEAEYGPAPYTSGNTVLWADLEAGRILHGPDQLNDTGEYINDMYARPGLSTIIPVDEHGTLLGPNSSVVLSLNTNTVSASWVVGDGGPVESAWTKSSDYAFDVQVALALMKPAQYFAKFLDTYNYYKNTVSDQWTNKLTNTRLTVADAFINGDKSSGTEVSNAGYINWVADYIRGLGIDPLTTLKTDVANIDVNLVHKFAGFTDKNYIKVLAEQASPTSTNSSVIVPDEDFDIHLYKSVPIKKVNYSAVIVVKSAGGYRVEGYDYNNPYFTIIPSRVNSDAYTIKVGNQKALIYKDYEKIKLTVPYGYEFKTKQQVVDFFVSYERYLKSQGFVFNQPINDLGETRNWLLSAKEFLHWSAQGWVENSVIVFSPVIDTLNLISTNYVIDAVDNTAVGSKILDNTFKIRPKTQYRISRLIDQNGNNSTSVTLEQGVIGFVELHLVQYEHIFVFNNVTVFNDIIYKPELGNRQYRMKFVGYKTADWNGSPNTPGFILNQQTTTEWHPNTDYNKGDIVIYNQTPYTALSDLAGTDNFQINGWAEVDADISNATMLPNLNNKSGVFQTFYDVNDVNLESDFTNHSKALIGFSKRAYLEELGVTDVSQLKLYQGYIKEKGTLNSVNALTTANFDKISGNINLYEEWAVRTGEFGALDSSQYVEVELPETEFAGTPSYLEFIANSGVYSDKIVSYKKSDLYKWPTTYTENLFNTVQYDYENSAGLITAGYPRLDDIDLTVFDLADYTNLNASLTSISVGALVWVAKDFDRKWNVYRVTETDVNITDIVTAEAGTQQVIMQCNNQHNLIAGDIVVLRNSQSIFDGVFRVDSINDIYSFTVTLENYDLSSFEALNDIAHSYLMKFNSVRYDYLSDVASFTPTHGWKPDDLVFIDTDDTDGNWAVYKKQDAWTANGEITRTANVNLATFGSSVTISSDQTVALVGAPADGTGKVVTYTNINGQFVQDASALSSNIAGAAGFGATIVTSTANLVIVGDPTATSSAGAVTVYSRSGNVYTRTQNINGSASDQFGYSLAVSDDGSWLYVGAPGNNKVYAYYKNGSTYSAHTGNVSVTGSDSASGDLFGYSVACSTDGRQLIVGAPNHDTGSVSNSGAVYIFDKTTENFVANGVTAAFTTHRTPTSKYTVYIDGTVVTSGFTLVGSTFTFSPVIAAGKVITIDTNNLVQFKELSETTGVVDNKFGTGVEICNNNCTLYVGSPANDGAYGDSGSVYRYTNQGRVYAEITGTVTNPTVTAGHSLRINGYEVVFTSTTLTSVISDINNKAIPGVTASNVSNQLYITSDTVRGFNRLEILPGNNTAPLTALGLDIYVLSQTINNPLPSSNAKFGEKIFVTDDSATLFVTGTGGTTYLPTTFDSGATVLDTNTIRFTDPVVNGGSVYVFDYLDKPGNTAADPSLFGFTQQLCNSDISAGDKFGASIATAGDTVLIGAPQDDLGGNNAGLVFKFTNTTGTKGWTRLRNQEARVDLDYVNNLYIYNKVSGKKVVTLDYIDPGKGKIAGEAAENIDYITSYDPARYNYNTSSSGIYDTALTWGDAQVGQIWWDVSACKFIDYEQGDFTYRSTNWGMMFPGSSVNVYQWVKSIQLPSEYTGAGTVKNPADTKYVVETLVNPVSGVLTTYYYYWVSGITAQSSNKKTLSIAEITNMIADPNGQGVEYAVLLDASTVGLYNVDSYIAADNAVLHIDYDVQKNYDLIHSEYTLLQEGNPDIDIPDKIWRKMLDSLAGYDSLDKAVPDTNLPVADKYGVSFRPRQSMVVEREAAVVNLINWCNLLFMKHPISELINLNYWVDKTPVPTAASGRWDIDVDNLLDLSYLNVDAYTPGTLVLVREDSSLQGFWTIYELNGTGDTWVITDDVQAYDTMNAWSYADYYSEGFSATTVVNHTVPEYKDLVSLSAKDGAIVKVLNNGRSQWELYQLSGTTYTSIALQNGTVQVDADYLNASTTLPIVVKNILNGIRYDIFVKTLKSELSNFLFVFFRYVLSEQKQVDWLFKTSFISVLHKIRKLAQFNNYQNDNQTYLQQYIEEVKPYRTILREYVLDYEGNDYYNGDVTDFDVPAYYDTTLGRYRSPSGEESTDSIKWTQPEYISWYQNYGMRVDSIIIENAGTGYVSNPDIIITGGGGTGAEAYAVVSGGSLREIVVTKSGDGYTSNPTIIIDGGSGSDARAYAVLKNSKVRSFNTTLKFDRLTYKTQVYPWFANTHYTTDTLVTYDHGIYIVANTFTSGSSFSGDNLEPYDQELLSNTNDRIAALYNAGAGQPGLTVDTFNVTVLSSVTANANVRVSNISNVHVGMQFTGANLVPSVVTGFANIGGVVHATLDHAQTISANSTVTVSSYDFGQIIDGIDYPADLVFGPGFVGTTSVSTTMVGNVSATKYLTVASNVGIVAGMTITGTGTIPATVISPSVIINGNSYVQMDTEQTISNGAVLTFSISDNITYDSRYYGSFADVALGTRAEDLIIDGAKFVDTYNSHAPEELVPGQAFDTLDMKVYSTPGSDYDNNGAGPEIRIHSFASQTGEDTFSYDQPGSLNDTIFVYSKQLGYQRPGLNFTQNFVNRTITLVDPLGPQDNLYIYVFGSSGANEITNMEYYGNGTKTDFRLPVPLDLLSGLTQSVVTDTYDGLGFEVAGFDGDTLSTTSISSFVLINGVKTTNYSIQATETNAKLVFSTPPSANEQIHVYLFNNGSSTTQTFMEINTNFYNVTTSNPTYPYTPIFPQDYRITLDSPIYTASPLSDNVIVEFGGLRLRPSNTKHVIADGLTNKFYVSTTAQDLPDSIADTDIKVSVDGRLLQIFQDYVVTPNDHVTTRSVQLFNTPVENSIVAVSIVTGADFVVTDANTITLLPTANTVYDLNNPNEVKVVSFSNHDSARIWTQVFQGTTSATISTTVGYDALGYEADAFDSTTTSSLTTKRFTLDRDVNNLSYTWVTLRGVKLLPNYDFIIENGNTLVLADSISMGVTDVLVVTLFCENTQENEIGFRIFNDMLGNTGYYRINASATTELAQPLNWYDTEIVVADASGLGEPNADAVSPGVVFIGAERVTYWAIDYATNTLSQIRRGTSGTSFPKLHPVETTVTDASAAEVIPNSADTVTEITTSQTLTNDQGDSVVIVATASEPASVKTGRIWYDLGPGAATNGLGLQSATTEQALFLQERPCKLPV